MGDSTGGESGSGSGLGSGPGLGSGAGPDSELEGFAPPDRGFRSDRAPERDQRFEFPASPSVPSQAGPMYPVVSSGYYAPPPMPGRQNSGMAVTGLVLGVLSLVLFWTPLGPVLAVPGIVFSGIGISQCSRPERSGTGMAIAGLVCSLISAIIWLAIALLIAALVW